MNKEFLLFGNIAVDKHKIIILFYIMVSNKLTYTK